MSAAHPQDLSLREQARAIADGDLDATDLLHATLARIEQRDGRLNSIADRFASDSARMLAEAPDGPLTGVPVAVKDMFALPWRAPRDGSVQNLFGMEKGESAVYRRLRDAGAVIVAVTNMHELGRGSTGHLSGYGPCGNPWDPTRCAGGSSSGSGAAVGARLVAGAIGSDGGGSIRYPSSYCGVTGLKLTWGSVPTDGYTVGFGSMEAIGPMCRDAADARLLAGALLGRPLSNRRADSLRIGIVPGMWADLEPEVEAATRLAVDVLAEGGMTVREIGLEGIEWIRIATVLKLSADTLPATRPGAFAEIEPEVSPVVRALVKYQMLLPAAALARVDVVRGMLRRSLARAFAEVDLLAWPTTPAPAPPLAEPMVDLPSGRYPADHANVRMGGVANLSGVPGISVPCGLAGGALPIGLQLLAPWGDDERLLDAAELLEQLTERRWVNAMPPVVQETAA